MDDKAQQLIDQNRNTYNTIASYFSDTRSFLWDELKPLATYTKPGNTVLDLGCGNGRLYQMFAKKQGEEGQDAPDISYIGIDQSEELIKIAQEKIPEGAFYVGQLTDIPLDDACVDVIYCIAAFHHLPNEALRIACLNEMKRVLKPGGYIVMTNWNLHSKSTQKNIEKGKWRVENSNDFIVPWLSPEGKILGERYYYGFEFDELRKLFEQSDLEILEHYFVKKGEKSDQEEGNNIVSVVIKK